MIRITSHTPPSLYIVIFSAAFSVACGGGNDKEDDEVEDVTASSDGTVTDDWSGYCTATFTEDYQVTDFFGDDTFVAEEGEAYLVARAGDAGTSTDLFFLTTLGPEEFEVPLGSDAPVELSCGEDVEAYYAVFDDVTVYATEDLETELCELSQGDVASVDGGTGYATTDVNFSGSIVYEVILGGFSEQCGAARGYVSVPQIRVWGTTTWLVPFGQVYAPVQ